MLVRSGRHAGLVIGHLGTCRLSGRLPAGKGSVETAQNQVNDVPVVCEIDKRIVQRNAVLQRDAEHVRALQEGAVKSGIGSGTGSRQGGAEKVRTCKKGIVKQHSLRYCVREIDAKKISIGKHGGVHGRARRGRASLREPGVLIGQTRLIPDCDGAVEIGV